MTGSTNNRSHSRTHTYTDRLSFLVLDPIPTKLVTITLFLFVLFFLAPFTEPVCSTSQHIYSTPLCNMNSTQDGTCHPAFGDSNRGAGVNLFCRKGAGAGSARLAENFMQKMKLVCHRKLKHSHLQMTSNLKTPQKYNSRLLNSVVREAQTGFFNFKSLPLDNYCMDDYISAEKKLFNPNRCSEQLLIS